MDMTPAQQLQDWLADRERQRRTQQGIDGFARDWNAGATQHAFEHAMSHLPAQNAEAVAEAARALFADDDWVDRLIERLAAAMRADPFFDPPFRAMSSDIHGGLILFEHEHMSVGAGVTRFV